MTAKEEVLKQYPNAVCQRGLHPLYGFEYRIYLWKDELRFTASTAKQAWAEAAYYFPFESKK